MAKLNRRVTRAILLLAFLPIGFGLARPAHALGFSRLPAQSLKSVVAISPFSCNRPVRVMPLGDSITRGSASGTPVDPQYYISYRRDLYKNLVTKGYFIDFVGSQKEDGSSYADFDRDHEGWPGKKDEYIAQNIYTWLNNNPADILLLHIGTNDMSSMNPDTRAADVEQILNEVDRFDPGIWVIIARIVQRVPYDPDTETYNNNVDQMLDTRIQAGDKIQKVDMENGAGIVYALYPAGDMSNELHPYATGYTKMAVKWEQALQTLLPPCGCVIGRSSSLPDFSAPGAVCHLFLPVVDYRALP